jgi:hypothetical protein
MCPACLTTVALIAAGASSTGGLAALVVRTLRPKSGGRDEANLPCPSASDDATPQETAR